MILVICPVSQIISYRCNEEARGLACETNPNHKKSKYVWEEHEAPQSKWKPCSKRNIFWRCIVPSINSYTLSSHKFKTICL